MHRYIENLTDKQYDVIRNAAGQIAGRKPRRKHVDYNIPRQHQYRARYSPYKDIADATREQMAEFMKNDYKTRSEGGGLYGAFADVTQTMHTHIKRNGTYAEGAEGGGLADITNTFKNLAGTAGVQIDVAADDFLNRIGLRHTRKYSDSVIDENLKDHANLHKDAYLKLNDRKGTDRFEYVARHSTDKYATYLDKNNNDKVVVAFRGTDPKDALHNNDLIEDVNIAAGNVNAISEFDDYRQHVKNMLDEYGDGNVSLSGYSLGGAKAVALTREADLRSRLGTTMALAPGMTATDSKLQEKSHDTKIQYYYASNDGVANALLNHTGNNHHVFYNESNPIKSHMILDKWGS